MTTLHLYPSAHPQDALTVVRPSPQQAIEAACELLGLNPRTWDARFVGDVLAGYDDAERGLTADLQVRN